MIKLMSLEMRKNRIGKYILRAAILALCVTVIMVIYLFANFYEGPEVGTGFSIGGPIDESAFDDGFFADSGLGFFSNIPRAATIAMTVVFLIFASSMLNNFVLGEYRNKTLSVMYTCPISRKTVFYAKFVTVIVFSFIATIIATLLCSAVMFFVSNLSVISISLPLSSFNLSFFLNLVFQAAAASIISLVPLMVGMMMKSTAATIWTSIIVAILMQGTVTVAAGTNQFSFGEFARIAIIPLALIAIGVIVTLITINAEVKKDLIL